MELLVSRIKKLQGQGPQYKRLLRINFPNRSERPESSGVTVYREEQTNQPTSAGSRCTRRRRQTLFLTGTSSLFHRVQSTKKRAMRSIGVFSLVVVLATLGSVSGWTTQGQCPPMPRTVSGLSLSQVMRKLTWGKMNSTKSRTWPQFLVTIVQLLFWFSLIFLIESVRSNIMAYRAPLPRIRSLLDQWLCRR